MAKKPAAKVTKGGKVQESQQRRLGRRVILKEKQKENEKDNGEEGEGEEMFTDDEVIHTVTSRNLKTHQQLLDAKLCSVKEIDKGPLPNSLQMRSRACGRSLRGRTQMAGS